jgi:hypothetical protein
METIIRSVPANMKIIIKRFEIFEQCCGFRMFIPDPDFFPSLFPDLATKKMREKQ